MDEIPELLHHSYLNRIHLKVHSGFGINAFGNSIKYSDPENAFKTIRESEQPYSEVTISLTL